MALTRLSFSKSWTDPADFPTVETDETVIRQDMQQLHDETKNYLNGTLLPAIEAGYAPAERTVNGHPLTANVTVTKGDVGLGQVDNTADMDKPVSTAQAAAIQAVAMGQIPAGSVEKAMLAAGVAAAVGRAEEGGGLDQKITDTAAGKAALLHAAQHGASGSDPITPEAIGAVKKSGDTMTGNLSIMVNAVPSIILNSDGGTANIFKNASAAVEDGTHIQDHDNNGNSAVLILRGSAGLDNCLAVNLNGAIYPVLHTGNLSTHISIRSKAMEYTGTGTTSVSVAVGFVPRLVVVQEVVSGTGAPGTYPLLLTNAGVNLGLYRGSGGDLSSFKITVTAFGETVSWECISRTEANNISGSTYKVIAIG